MFSVILGLGRRGKRGRKGAEEDAAHLQENNLIFHLEGADMCLWA